MVLILGATVLTFGVHRTASREVVLDRPLEVRTDGYVSSDKCRSCHPGQYSTWHASYHRTMTRPATPENVKGDFSGVEIPLYERHDDGRVVGERLVMGRTGDEFWIEMNDPAFWGKEGDVPRVREEIVMITGSHHAQVYWYRSGRGRMLEIVPLVYLLEDERWVPFGAIFLHPYAGREPLGNARWNRVCITCHTTNSQPRMNEREFFDSWAAEFGIACEECHGPAEEHVAAHSNPLERYATHFAEDEDGADPTIVDPTDLPHPRQSQVCGQCHGILFYREREELLKHHTGSGASYEPGDDLDETRLVVQPARIDEQPQLQKKVVDDPHFLTNRFWSDGMVRVSGREFNMVEESPCYRGEEFSCLSCHVLHRADDDARSLAEWADDLLKPGMRGDEACLQCHEMDDVTAHTYHEASSSGSRCYNCHMPYTTYGLLKAIRSHQVSVPDVAASLETGRPNACNQCHLDRSMGWAADHLEEWYGVTPPVLTEEQRETAASALWALTGDAGQRALMAWSFGWEPARKTSGEDWIPPYLITLLEDPYPTVRYIAYRSLRRLPGFADFEFDYLDVAGRGRYLIRANDLWNRASPPERRAGLETTLFDERGMLRVDRFAALAERRDDTVIRLVE